MKTINSIKKVNQLSENEFIGTFGNVFEKTNWIANKAFNSKPYKDFDEFKSKMITIYENSSKEDCLKIFNAHPELAVEKKLTEDSHKEQKISFKEKFQKIPWSKSKESFKKWSEGRTGFPIVDAGMRQLNESGFMHNRVRMIL